MRHVGDKIATHSFQLPQARNIVEYRYGSDTPLAAKNRCHVNVKGPDRSSPDFYFDLTSDALFQAVINGPLHCGLSHDLCRWTTIHVFTNGKKVAQSSINQLHTTILPRH